MTIQSLASDVARKDVVMSFDGNSAIRERLALLAEEGPSLNPIAWGYNPSRDRWYRCDGDPARKTFTVGQEGSASLDLIQSRWNMDRNAAMTFIGYPEQD